MSSSRPTNGLMMYAPALAASSACPGEKHSVTLTRMPSDDRALVAWMPSRVSGHFTTMFLWILASSLPSLIIAEASVDTTSALISPSTMSQIRRTCSAIGRPSFAISVGFVVTPSTMPQLAPFFSSSRFAVSRKIFKDWPLVPSLAKSCRPAVRSARMRTSDSPHTRYLLPETGERLFGAFKSRFKGFAVPGYGLPKVLRHTSAILIHDAQIIHSYRKTSIGRLAIPGNGLRIVPRYPAAIRIHDTQIIHSYRKISIGRVAIPPNGLRIVLRYAPPSRILRAQIVHSVRIAGVRPFAIPRNGLRTVLRYTPAGEIHPAQIGHTSRIASRSE